MIIARYEILAELGRGTTGVVYKAQDTIRGRVVALKVATFLPNTDRATKSGRFLREARNTAYLSTHLGSAIPPVTEVGDSEGTLFLVREFIEGDTLEHLVGSRTMKLRVIDRSSIQGGALSRNAFAG
ncbi:MAG: hypothetical protein HY040_14315 [Planctomycetes bacterium]|nr:hypothetical protein [Planctomycetota bacterium]